MTKRSKDLTEYGRIGLWIGVAYSAVALIVAIVRTLAAIAGGRVA